MPGKLPGFFASVAGIPLIEQVAQRGKIIFPLFAVHAIVHRNEMDVVLQEKNLGVHPHLKVVPPKPRHILYNDAPDLAGLYIRDHLLEPWALKRCPTHSVVDIEPDVVVSPFPGIPLQHLALERDLSRVFSPNNHIHPRGNNT